MGGTGAACALLVDDDAAQGGMASVPAMLAFLTQQPRDGEPGRSRPQARREAAPEQSEGSMTGNLCNWCCNQPCPQSKQCKGARTRVGSV